MTFTLTVIDQYLAGIAHSIEVEDVDDVGGHGGLTAENKIKFQFPPVIKSDKKKTRWKSINNTIGYEPKYMYEGSDPRGMSIEAVYIVGGPPIGGPGGGGKLGATVLDVQKALRTWKKYFYFSNFAGGGGQEGKNLPIWRIRYMGSEEGFIGIGGSHGSSWRCLSYSVKYSDEWILGQGVSHPLISTISMEMEMATGVDVTGEGDPKMDFGNIANKPFASWY